MTGAPAIDILKASPCSVSKEDASIRSICKVCCRAVACYTCPRCQIVYCSLGCYKAHDERCTEGFFKAQVEEELRTQSATGDERRRLEQVMLELNNLGEGDEYADDMEEETGDDCERFAALAESAERGELTIDDLSQEERQLFHSELRRGVLSRSIEPWEPWWQRPQLDIIEDAGSGASLTWSPPAHICCSGPCAANPAVALTVLEGAYAYAHTKRYFNGDCEWDPLQASLHFLHLSPAIRSRRVVHAGAKACVRSSLDAAATLPGGRSALDQLCLSDAVMILRRGMGSAGRALSEVADLITGVAQGLEVGESRCPGQLQRTAKKIEFLASFAAHHEDELLPLASVVEELQRASSAAAEEHRFGENVRKSGGVAIPMRVDDMD